MSLSRLLIFNISTKFRQQPTGASLLRGLFNDLNVMAFHLHFSIKLKQYREVFMKNSFQLSIKFLSITPIYYVYIQLKGFFYSNKFWKFISLVQSSTNSNNSEVLYKGPCLCICSICSLMKARYRDLIFLYYTKIQWASKKTNIKRNDMHTQR